MSKAVILSILLAFAEARFSQEQIPVAAVQALSAFDGNAPGTAATLAGGVPGSLLAGANACAKLELADQIVSKLGTDPQVIDAAKALVAAEQNFNPFAVSVPKICDDASLPATAELRGVVPLVDPNVVGSDTENANSATSLQNAFDATGLSVAGVMIAQGFSNFTLGETGTAAAGGAANTGGNAGNNNNNNNNNNNAGNDNANTGNADANTGNNNNTQNCNNNAGNANNNAGNNADANTGNTGNNNSGVQQSTIAGLDFGLCVPTMKFVGGLGNRPDTEFTFQAIDPLVALGQQEALNPNIITNRICDQLTNVCEANQAAKDECLKAKGQIALLTVRDRTVAVAWNKALGFDGASTT